MSGLVTDDLVDDLLRLVEEPDGQGHPVSAAVRTADRSRHPGTETNLDRRIRILDTPENEPGPNPLRRTLHQELIGMRHRRSIPPVNDRPRNRTLSSG